MIYTSLAVLALSASAAVSPFSHLVHMHPHTKPVDTRVSLTLSNKNMMFRDVTVGGETYTIKAMSSVDVKAPAGTVVYVGTTTLAHKRGDVLLEVSPKLNGQTVVVN